ncbi:MAG: UPF0182 family membrane protein [Acidimicrobiales bacterium]
MPPAPRASRVSGRGRLIAIIAAALVVVLVLSLRGIAIFYTDFLWFDSLGQGDVFTGILAARVALVVIFTGVFFGLSLFNLYLADRLAPAFRPPGPEEELLERYHDTVGRRPWLVRVAVSLLFALVAGVGVADQWNEWILFTNRVDFGETDAQFGRDIGFYVFQLPFLSYVVSWLFAAFVIIFIITAVAHYLNGGIRVQTIGQRVTPQVKAHLSVLLAVLALIKAADYWLARFRLTTSTSGTVDGVTYTDLNARLPAINLLLLISLLAAGLLLYNIRRRGWTMPLLAVGLWAFVNLMAATAYPAFVQRFRVEPAESSRESEFIVRNIEATRAAYRLDDLVQTDFELGDRLEADDLEASRHTITNTRLLDPVVVADTYELLEGEREFYQYASELDVDRYEVSGQVTPGVIGIRELNPVSGSWENQHVTFTHGYGLSLAPANAVNPKGEPDFAISGIPARVGPEVASEIGEDLDLPQVYYGENFGGYAIVGATKDETDYEAGPETVTNRFEGEGGVGIGSFMRQAAFALRFGEIDPLISDLLTSESRVFFVREVQDRVAKVAPFLELDSDVYPVVVDGRVVYMVDGYTTTDRYPYSQRADTRDLASDADLRRRFNYVRNSVKAVVDAYDGTVELYVIDDSDPIIRAYAKAFPSLFSDIEELPEGLRDHLRYPEDLFRVQTNMWARYHVGDASTFYAESQHWAVAQDPGRGATDGAGEEASFDEDTNTRVVRDRRVDPYHQLIQLPGDDEPSFVQIRTFVPQSGDEGRKELTAFMVANGDFDRYGELISYEMPTREVPGPAIVASNISTEGVISSELTQLNQQGSTVQFGDLVLLPVGDSIVYVRAMYVEASGTTLPRVQFVIAVDGDRVAFSTSLNGALKQLVRGSDDLIDELLPQTTGPTEDGIEAVGPDDPEPTDPGTGDQTVDDLVAELLALQEEQGELTESTNALLAEILRQAGIEVETTTTTTEPPPEPAPTTTTEPEPESA